MKQHKYKNISGASMVFAFLAGLCVLCMYSCKKESDTQNLPTPVIDRVAFIDSSAANTPVTSTVAGTILVIYGQNLSGTQRILMNGLEASFNPNYVLNTSIIVHIPYNVPTKATFATVSNTIEVITDHGSATTNFDFVQAAPVIYSINNENTRPGGTMVIRGANMYALSKVIFPGRVAVDSTGFTYTKDGTTLTVQVPSNVAGAGLLTVSGLFGNGFSPGPVNLYSGLAVFCNFDDRNTFGGKTAFVGTDTAAFPGGRGNYGLMKFGAVAAGDDAYYTDGNGRSFQMISGRWVPATDKHPALANYAVKFEMFVSTPWKAGSIFIVSTRNDSYSARVSSPDPLNGFTSAGWYTVSVPLTDFKLADVSGRRASGDVLTDFKLILDNSNAAPMDLRFINDDATAVESFSAGIDNIRVVKVVP